MKITITARTSHGIMTIQGERSDVDIRAMASANAEDRQSVCEAFAEVVSDLLDVTE